MNVSVIIPAQAAEARQLASTLDGILGQLYDGGGIEVFVVQYGGGDGLTLPSLTTGQEIKLLAVDHPSPYAARNFAASQATGEALLFTEPGCVPEPQWVRAHVSRLLDSTVTVSIGPVAPARVTSAVEMFLSYEDTRDAWVFSCGHWQHYFGRPKNMAVARRRFETHGPFAEVMRGADSKLVQKVAREISCGEIALTPEAVVRQQSVRGIPSCFRDRFIHGRALQVHQSSHSAPISLERRLSLFRGTLDQRGYGPMKAAGLVGLLAAGILAFRIGGWAGSAARRREIVLDRKGKT